MTTQLTRRFTVALALAGAVAFVPSLAAQTPTLRPGKYEATLRQSIMGEAVPPETDEQCFAAADLERLDRWLASQLGKACVVSDRRATGAKTTFTVTCDDDQGHATTRGELTTRPDAWDAVLRTTDDASVESVITVAGKRVGDCTK